MRKYVLLLSMVFISTAAFASDYPTEQIVRSVIDCMTELGGINDQNLYTCTCRMDYTMSHMTYDEYDDASVFDHNQKMPGDRGGIVRDNEIGKAASVKYQKVLSEGEKSCPVVIHIEPVKKPQAN